LLALKIVSGSLGPVSQIAFPIRADHPPNLRLGATSPSLFNEPLIQSYLMIHFPQVYLTVTVSTSRRCVFA
jgi:hypothetical protein